MAEQQDSEPWQTTVHLTETFCKEVCLKHHPSHRRGVDKPCALEAYIQHMGAVDTADKQITSYMVLHRSTCTTWWRKIIFYLLEICFCNSLVIWKVLQRTRVDAKKFRLTINHGLLDGHQAANSCRRGRLPANPPERI